jgi:mono/diheme cytochrome c family protein
MQKNGYDETLKRLQEESHDYKIPPSKLEEVNAQLHYIKNVDGITDQDKKEQAINKINADIEKLVGSEEVAATLEADLKSLTKDEIAGRLSDFIEKNKSDQLKGSLFSKAALLNFDRQLVQHIQNTESFHNPLTKDKKVEKAVESDIDLLTSHYQKGEELFISQACYACHRISGLSRGGVGPELTQIGKSYPWYIKQSIVWPQADLPTSTMPNMRLDHSELEDLVTFLMAQIGENRAVSSFQYASSIKAWEEGKKQSWEEPISPDKIYNLDVGMMIFAEQGCAACHSLRGYESNVGFSIEKEKVDFDKLYQEQQWFQQLFPEDIVGSQLVNILDKHGKEIDQRIVDGVRENSILERIEKEHPGLIASFYSPFEYAMRAKNFEYSELLKNEPDKKKRETIQKDWDAWKERVRRTLMIFVQEYGLGRLICPRLDWSGIYRSDEWLMEHFYKPTVHTAKSIMPVFPFDSTKFLALTSMLDVLAKRNRDAVRQIWEHRGFNPAIAYKIYCAQCHGEYLQGNGPVLEWIYPIPKNLHDPTFLQNLTRERVINSIIHGVKGTPMAPWGEIAPDKPFPNKTAVISRDEIEQLTSWLFSSLPSGGAAREEEIPKWKYEPEDVLKELQREGDQLKPGVPDEYYESEQSSKKSSIAKEPAANDSHYAGIFPYILLSQIPDFFSAANNKQEGSKAEDIFDIYPNPLGPEKYSYYIKKKYYTKENLEMGEKLFIANCSICHGKEGDGTGVRAATMREAKPRMLTNLDWLHTRDDLRLLRSIKYGVPGTSMTPWGDFTSTLQRIQMVMFIRELSIEPELRKELASLLYQVFTAPEILLGALRSSEYKSIEKLKSEYEEAQNRREKFAANFEKEPNAANEIVENYKKEFDLKLQLSRHEAVDNLLVELIGKLEEEKVLYDSLGSFIIAKKMDEQFIEGYFNLIRKIKNRYAVENEKIQFHLDPKTEQEILEMGQHLIQELDGKIASFEAELKLNEAKLPSKERNELIDYLTKEMHGLTTVKEKMISVLNESLRLNKKQAQLVNEYNEVQL